MRDRRPARRSGRGRALEPRARLLQILFLARGIAPAELRIDLPRAELAALFAAAGIYAHSAVANRPRAGGPASIAEAMATGAYVIARRAQPFASIVDGPDALYRDLAEAAALIRATEAWTDAEWRAAQNRSIERAFQLHADEIVLRPLFDDWCAIAGQRAVPAVAAL